MKDLSLGRILVVDDEDLTALKIAEVLRRAFYEPIIVNSGEEALKRLREGKIDLILLDIEMPGMDGFEVCKVINKDRFLKEIPVLFLTGYQGANHILKAFSVGAKDYISKPFNYKELLARVDTNVKLKRQTDKLKTINKTLASDNKEFIDSISYAKYIQESILQPIDKIGESVEDFFVFYQPKSMVSGDFYWYKRIKNFFYVAAVDCTGHGVPGAFMSMLGITALNDVINSRHINSPSNVLKKLRKKIKKQLNQNLDLNENKNGFDMSLCCIDLENRTLVYAGANLPLYHITHCTKTYKPELIIKKPNPMPVGVHPNDDEDFRDHSISLQEGDVIYIFSDGYSSQFGGDFGKKMGSKSFRNFLFGIYNQPMSDQKDLLEKNINLWRGDEEQVDDILVIGLKF